MRDLVGCAAAARASLPARSHRALTQPYRACCAGLTPDGQTLGTPIAVLVRNKDQRSGDYSEMSVRPPRRCAAPRCPPRLACALPLLAHALGAQVAYRPSHADATYDMKYGVRAIAVRCASRPQRAAPQTLTWRRARAAAPKDPAPTDG